MCIRKICIIAAIMLVFPLTFFGNLTLASGKIELAPVEKVKLGVKPIDVASSDDGKIIFVLTKKDLILYSLDDKRVVHRIHLLENFDRIRYSGKANLIVLTSTKTGSLKTMKIERVFFINIAGHPFKGPADAPVTIAVFDDYQ